MLWGQTKMCAEVLWVNDRDKRFAIELNGPEAELLPPKPGPSPLPTQP